ncbi:hypothetical protein NKL07_32895 [Mesorhizobium sp. C280B]|uniref:hypothetical protein n=1 Tax=unclassified Mesorhizobium TaxID=325217 RepID=UPI0012EB8B3C|nr:hypothetical protein [Mesorhizobium sp. LSJC280B00]
MLQNFIKQLRLWINEAVNDFSSEHSNAHVSACGFVFFDDDTRSYSIPPHTVSSPDERSENARCSQNALTAQSIIEHLISQRSEYISASPVRQPPKGQQRIGTFAGDPPVDTHQP